MQRLREAAILIPDGVENAAMVAAKGSGVSLFDTLYGAVKFFTEEHIQWDVVDASMDWSDLRTLLVATPPANEAALGKLEAFVASGGSFLSIRTRSSPRHLSPRVGMPCSESRAPNMANIPALTTRQAAAWPKACPTWRTMFTLRASNSSRRQEARSSRA
jgi:hypothetical protein